MSAQTKQNEPLHTVGIRWPDGKVQTAPNWETLEEVIRVSQYDIPDRNEFRDHMERRAKLWSGTEIMVNGDANDFFYELERAQLLRRLGNGLTVVDPSPREPIIIDLELYRTGGRVPAEQDGESNDVP